MRYQPYGGTMTTAVLQIFEYPASASPQQHLAGRHLQDAPRFPYNLIPAWIRDRGYSPDSAVFVPLEQAQNPSFDRYAVQYGYIAFYGPLSNR
ncbi:hypothetical protein D3C80_1444630 [compost metagenome]